MAYPFKPFFLAKVCNSYNTCCRILGSFKSFCIPAISVGCRFLPKTLLISCAACRGSTTPMRTMYDCNDSPCTRKEENKGWRP